MQFAAAPLVLTPFVRNQNYVLQAMYAYYVAHLYCLCVKENMFLFLCRLEQKKEPKHVLNQNSLVLTQFVRSLYSYIAIQLYSYIAIWLYIYIYI